jgi:hypothetical protein
MAYKDPVRLATASGFTAGTTVVAGRGEILEQIAEMLAIGKFAEPWHRKHISIPWLSDQSPRLVGSKTCIRDHDHLTAPGRGTKSFSICCNRLF